MLPSSGEDLRKLLGSGNVGGSDRVEAAPRLGRNQVRDGSFACTGRADQEQPCGDWNLEPFGLPSIHQPDQISQVPFDRGREDEIAPVDGLYQRPVCAAAFVECSLQIPLFNPAILQRGKRRSFIHQVVPAFAPLGRKRAKILGISAKA